MSFIDRKLFLFRGQRVDQAAVLLFWLERNPDPLVCGFHFSSKINLWGYFALSRQLIILKLHRVM